MSFLHLRRPAIREAAVAFATLATSAAMISAGMTAAQAAAGDRVDVNLLDINDFHGRIDANTVKFAGTVEQLRSGTTRTFPVSNGAAAVAFALPRRKTGAMTLTLTAAPSGTTVSLPVTVAKRATVTSADGTPTGKVGVYDGRRLPGKGKLHHGKALVPLHLPRHHGSDLTVKYLGDDAFATSTDGVRLPRR